MTDYKVKFEVFEGPLDLLLYLIKKEEVDIYDVNLTQLATQFIEYIEVMRKLWTEPRSSHSGEFVSFEGVLSYPKPAAAKGVPVWFGGESTAALRRVAEYGDGWLGFKVSPAAAGDKIRRIEEMLKANGRRRSDVTLAVSPYTDPITPDDLKRYHDAGADEVALLMRGRRASEAELITGLEGLARDFVEPAARL